MGFFDSEIVQQEAKQLFEDYQSLIKLGSSYGKFDREGKKMFMALAQNNKFMADTTEQASYFSDSTLSRYSAVVFLNTTGDVLNQQQQASFEKFIKSGKGFVGIHSAADTEFDWSWYGRLVGAYFKNHPDKEQRALYVRKNSSQLTSSLPENWYRRDEIYNFHALPQNVEVLFEVIENSYQGGEHGEHHPMAWYHSYDGGRAFYTAMGHTKDSYTDSFFQQHVLNGLQYAIGQY